MSSARLLGFVLSYIPFQPHKELDGNEEKVDGAGGLLLEEADQREPPATS